MHNPQKLLDEIGVLRRRLEELQAMARRDLVHETLDEVFDVLVFHVGSMRAALLLDRVRETLMMCTLTSYPEASFWAAGLLNYHGMRVPVIDVLSRMTQAPRTPEDNEHIIVCDIDGRQAGFVVQSVEGVSSIRRESVQTVPSELPQAPYMLGVLDTPAGSVFLLSASCLLAVFEDVAA